MNSFFTRNPIPDTLIPAFHREKQDMNDKIKIILGLLVFVAAVTFPIWNGLIASAKGAAPELVLPADQKNCIESKEYMIANHMNMLDSWRNQVVREGKKFYKASDGKEYEMSLTNTCLKCHTDRTKFCDRCHEYSDVAPYCWDCHVDGKGE